MKISKIANKFINQPLVDKFIFWTRISKQFSIVTPLTCFFIFIIYCGEFYKNDGLVFVQLSMIVLQLSVWAYCLRLKLKLGKELEGLDEDIERG